VIVLDTHVLVWWLAQGDRLSARASRAISANARSGTLLASAISLFEISSLVRRNRLELRPDTSRWFAALRLLPELRVESVSADVCWRAGGLGVVLPGDPADRIIVATAQEIGAKLVTADARLRESGVVETIW
jgi:PIN domain nuclease of toxin-antitoxin system